MARNIPADLFPQILANLPVKSLLRFRCVSKPWLSLIDHNADFAQLHFNTFNNNSTRLFVAEYRGIDPDELDCVLRCPETFKTLSEISFPITCWYFVSFLDGLVLLNSCGSSNHLLKLWNPSIRQFHDIPPLPPNYNPMKQTLIGLGYDQLAKDYKLVTLIGITSVAIYSIGSGSWKINPLSNWRKSPWRTNSVCFQGILYFIAMDAEKGWNLVSFDLSKEVFSFVRVCDERFEPLYYMGESELVLSESRLYMPFYDVHTLEKSVWVLERETMNWTKFCSYNVDFGRTLYVKTLYVKKNGDLLISRRHRDKQREAMDEVATYNPRTHEYKRLESNTSFIRIEYVSVYIESLILHQCTMTMKKGV